ncbi:MAG: ChaN family lipoprotein [Planctomycetes bacterium]|nr:ChaN family lipoprotein [Planctomycetota bacterium]
MGKILDLQKELWGRVALQARRLGTAGRPQLREAVEAFESSFPESFTRVEKDRFLARLCSRPLVLVGDYHPLPRAQLSAAHLIRELEPDTVALEIISTAHQDTIDAWSRSEESAAKLLVNVDFQAAWPGIPPRGYEALLETARDCGCRILALDHPHAGTDMQPPFDVREAWMIEHLMSVSETRCIALIGDLHLEPKRMPKAFGNAAAIVHQNHPPYHFVLQERGISLPAVLQVASDRYVWQHTHPLLVEESCLAALAGDHELHAASPEELFPALLARVASMLGIDEIDAPTVLATYEPDQRELLPLVAKDRKQSTRLLDRLFLQGQAILDARLLVLHLPGSNHMAEAAGKWIYTKHAHALGTGASRELRLWHAIRLEAAGFFGSRLVNPMRTGKDLQWYQQFLDVQLPWDEVEANARRIREVFDGDRQGLAERALPPLGSPADLILTRVLGQEIGCRLARLTGRRRAAFDALLVRLQKRSQVEAALEAMRKLIGRLASPDWRGQ